MSTYAGVTNFQKTVRLFGPPCLSLYNNYPIGMVWYGMVNVDLYSAIVTKVSNALMQVSPAEITYIIFLMCTILQLVLKSAQTTLCTQVTHCRRNWYAGGTICSQKVQCTSSWLMGYLF